MQPLFYTNVNQHLTLKQLFFFYLSHKQKHSKNTGILDTTQILLIQQKTFLFPPENTSKS